MSNSATDSKKPSFLDVILVVALASLYIGYVLAGGTPEKEWKAAPGNALLGLNIFAWGITLGLAYRWPDRSLLLRGLAWLSSRFPVARGPLLTVCWSVFFLFTGALMFITGAGLA